jgi:hypothetical protein
MDCKAFKITVNLHGAGLTSYAKAPRLAVITFLAGFCVFIASPPTVQAGGLEFAAGGARGLGRGGASFLRADDPQVMVLNPALLADLPDNMAMLGGLMSIPNACIVPSGNLGWSISSGDVAILNKNEGPLYYGAQPGDKDNETGKDLAANIGEEPLPKSCYTGGIRPFPAIAGSMKIGDKLGLGLGFFPPDDSSVDAWGNRDGTVNTPLGTRPDIVRYSATYKNTTYFGLLAGVGYRVAPWLRVGLGLRWSMIVLNAKVYGNIDTSSMSPQAVSPASIYGKDLFVPGFVASIHAVPIDALDIAAGFRWEDRVRMNDAKADVITRVWGYDRNLVVRHENGSTETIQSTSPPYTTPNLPIKIEAPPILVPQLTFGIRFADRIRPRAYEKRKKFTDELRDSMNDERWDIEADFVYSFNSVYDRNVLSNDNSNNTIYFTAPTSNTINTYNFGVCPAKNLNPDNTCSTSRRETVTEFGGKNQWGVRLGGDYNVVPGFISLRVGGSFDSRGINPDNALAQNMNFQRIGAHAGLTVRIAKNTDITVAYAHFFYETIEVQLNEASDIPNLLRYAGDQAKADKYNIKVNYENGKPVLTKLDGVAKEAYYASNIKGSPNQFVNAGTYTMHMDVLGVNIAQHF